MIERNHVHHVGRGVLSDAGFIYCLGVSPGSVIRNNIFAMSANQALWPCMEKRPSTFRRNIIYLTQGELLVQLGQRWLEERLAAGEPLGEWNKNLYWHTQGPDRLRFYRHDFAAWQGLGLGLDRESLIADPLFVDPEHRNFQLRAASPATGLGFQPLNIQEVGLYGDPQWVAEASHAQCAAHTFQPVMP